MFDQICQKKPNFFVKFYILLHAIVSSSFIVIFQKPDFFLEFVIELTMRLYLSPKASSCRKCDIFWVLAFCCWSKKREGEHFFIHFFYSNRHFGGLTAISRSSKKPYYYFHYKYILFFPPSPFSSERASSFDRFMIYYELYRIFLYVKGSPEKVI